MFLYENRWLYSPYGQVLGNSESCHMWFVQGYNYVLQLGCQLTSLRSTAGKVL